MALFCDNLVGRTYCNVCRVCVYICLMSICVLRLHSSAADLDEHVGVCTCMFVCVSVLSLPPSLSLCVYYLSLSLSLSFLLSLVSSDDVIPHWSDDVMPCPHVITLPISRFCCKCTKTQCMYLISPNTAFVFRVCSYICAYHSMNHGFTAYFTIYGPQPQSLEA